MRRGIQQGIQYHSSKDLDHLMSQPHEELITESLRAGKGPLRDTLGTERTSASERPSSHVCSFFIFSSFSRFPYHLRDSFDNKPPFMLRTRRSDIRVPVLPALTASFLYPSLPLIWCSRTALS